MEIIRRIDEKFLRVMEAVMMLLEQNTDTPKRFHFNSRGFSRIEKYNDTLSPCR